MPLVQNQEIRRNLLKFQQRKLTKGETVLLALAIANSIALPSREKGEVDNIHIYLASKGHYIASVFYELYEYTYVDDDETKSIKDMVGRFLLWRLGVAEGTVNVFFTGEVDDVIDCLTGITSYLDKGILCSLSSLTETANYTYQLFTSFVKEVKHNIGNE